MNFLYTLLVVVGITIGRRHHDSGARDEHPDHHPV